MRQGGIPFEITTQTGPFYSEENMKALHHSIQQIKEGKIVTKTMEELLDMEK